MLAPDFRNSAINLIGKNLYYYTLAVTSVIGEKAG